MYCGGHGRPIQTEKYREEQAGRVWEKIAQVVKVDARLRMLI
jgi:hypothetical protein